MQLKERTVPLSNSTLSHLLLELSEECENITTLMHQLQLSNLSPTQQVQILSELLASTIHLQVHCGQEFQDLIAQEMENLPDDDESV